MLCHAVYREPEVLCSCVQVKVLVHIVFAWKVAHANSLVFLRMRFKTHGHKQLFCPANTGHSSLMIIETHEAVL